MELEIDKYVGYSCLDFVTRVCSVRGASVPLTLLSTQ